MTGALLAVILLAILLLSGVPIAVALGLVSTASIAVAKSSLMMLASRMYASIDTFVLLAIPFFCLAGDIMSCSGITERMIKFVNYIVGRVRGGLAQANIYTSMLFAGMTGAGVTDVAALGPVFIPSMVREGYRRDFSAALVAASAVIGPTIPPSILAVLYCSIAGLSVSTMFAALIVPGVLMGLSMSTYLALFARKLKLPKTENKFNLPDFFTTFKAAFFALLMPVIILGGMLGGICTPTEAAAIAVLYALLVSVFIYRTASAAKYVQALKNTVRTSAMLFFLIGFAGVLGWIIARVHLPQQMAASLLSISGNPTIIFVLVVVLLLIVGCFLDVGCACVILAPILAPMMKEIGINPVQFGATFIVTLNIGMITPPFGSCLFAVASVGKAKFEDVVKKIWPFVVVDVILVAMLVAFPKLTLFIPTVLGLTR
jgi:tripartite ATP-independent transporter DctM subunit